MSLSITSSAFKDGQPIPTKYSCDADNISPPLDFGQPPEGTGAFALIVDDPDSPRGVYTHWVIFNIPPETRRLAEGVAKGIGGQNLDTARQGKNSAGETGYGGPCPPAGPAHHYKFTLYALDRPLDLRAGAPKQDVLNAMRSHIIAQGTLTGTYQRR